MISRRGAKRQIALAAALLPVSGVLRLPSKLAADPELRAEVQAKLELEWSPE
ncbi:hypothetical protein LKL35_36625 [Streptomyces sp. ET3-23]|uniref:hypothetical protein n=1 Tax=Streptomyces sp. ET3-23 TaxID=2885643 RepID=UPI001D10CCB2|nr:hypothetical protein [Streptomyces sp. ET3-23]MCC2280855.1 hypothetical protein [Streptomyces sp. ET3-23]